MARVKLQLKPKVSQSEWTVTRAIETYLEYVANAVAKEAMSQGHYDTSNRFLNDLCAYCGALTMNELPTHVCRPRCLGTGRDYA